MLKFGFCLIYCLKTISRTILKKQVWSEENEELSKNIFYKAVLEFSFSAGNIVNLNK